MKETIVCVYYYCLAVTNKFDFKKTHIPSSVIWTID